MMLLTRPPDLILADFGHFLAVRTGDGDYSVAAGGEKIHRSFLVSETGGRLLPWPVRGDPAADGLDCAAEGRCSYTADGRRVAIVTAESGLPVLCDTVDAIVAQGAGGVRLPRQDPGCRSNRQLASGRGCAVARRGRHQGRRRE